MPFQVVLLALASIRCNLALKLKVFNFNFPVLLLFRTAIELTGLGDRIKPGPLGLEGFSVAPLLANPSLHQTSPQSWKRAAFSQYPRCMNSTLANQPPFLATRDPCVTDNANKITHMGYSMRTAEWRYAEWPVWKCFGLSGDPNRCADMSAQGAVWAGSADWMVRIIGVAQHNLTHIRAHPCADPHTGFFPALSKIWCRHSDKDG